jgi:hypothetical protein
LVCCLHCSASPFFNCITRTANIALQHICPAGYTPNTAANLDIDGDANPIAHTDIQHYAITDPNTLLG